MKYIIISILIVLSLDSCEKCGTCRIEEYEIRKDGTKGGGINGVLSFCGDELKDENYSKYVQKGSDRVLVVTNKWDCK